MCTATLPRKVGSAHGYVATSARTRCQAWHGRVSHSVSVIDAPPPLHLSGCPIVSGCPACFRECLKQQQPCLKSDAHIRGSIVASISARHAEDPGSIPGRGDLALPHACPCDRILAPRTCRVELHADRAVCMALQLSMLTGMAVPGHRTGCYSSVGRAAGGRACGYHRVPASSPGGGTAVLGKRSFGLRAGALAANANRCSEARPRRVRACLSPARPFQCLL